MQEFVHIEFNGKAVKLRPECKIVQNSIIGQLYNCNKKSVIIFDFDLELLENVKKFKIGDDLFEMFEFLDFMMMDPYIDLIIRNNHLYMDFEKEVRFRDEVYDMGYFYKYFYDQNQCDYDYVYDVKSLTTNIIYEKKYNACRAPRSKNNEIFRCYDGDELLFNIVYYAAFDTYILYFDRDLMIRFFNDEIILDYRGYCVTAERIDYGKIEFPIQLATDLFIYLQKKISVLPSYSVGRYF